MLKRDWKLEQLIGRIICAILLATGIGIAENIPPTPIRGIYLNPGHFGKTSINHFIDSAEKLGLNTVVLHAKDPRGFLYWQSKNPIATSIGAVKGKGAFESALRRLHTHHIWVIAKLDLFQDTRLAQCKPGLALLDRETGKPWRNNRGLCWVNPCNKRVWDYNISLAVELATLGVNEIQFDYIRFPSDGCLSRILYPSLPPGMNKVSVIGEFVQTAEKPIHQAGAMISVDLFGFTAWRRDDFGVGQRLENITPYVDAICPMLYPSHFPTGFLGMKKPAAYPKRIMQESMKRIAQRTHISVRPWLQGFWYTPRDIVKQLEGIHESGYRDFLIWNPGAHYDVSYKGLAQYYKKGKITHIIHAIHNPEQQTIQSDFTPTGICHRTNYNTGQTDLFFTPAEGQRIYECFIPVIGLLNETILDHILKEREIPVTTGAGKTDKVEMVFQLLCQDIHIKPGDLAPSAHIFIDWGKDCIFKTVSVTTDKKEKPGTQSSG